MVPLRLEGNKVDAIRLNKFPAKIAILLSVSLDFILFYL